VSLTCLAAPGYRRRELTGEAGASGAGALLGSRPRPDPDDVCGDHGAAGWRRDFVRVQLRSSLARRQNGNSANTGRRACARSPAAALLAADRAAVPSLRCLAPGQPHAMLRASCGAQQVVLGQTEAADGRIGFQLAWRELTLGGQQPECEGLKPRSMGH
jgi:hypothetical protein